MGAIVIDEENRLSISAEGMGTYEVVIKNGAIAEVRYRTGGSRSMWRVAPAFGLLNFAVSYPKEFGEWITAVRRRVKVREKE